MPAFGIGIWFIRLAIVFSYLLSSKERHERSNKHSYCFNELSSMIMVQSKPVCVSGVFVDRAPVRAYLHGPHGPFSAAR